ncbi:CCA tRNA nucleotidyltransferase, mitochondrial [Tolypocladium ophioglossoides CBS 100239]|uniref:CCA tRNA nucleotidyltransferase, mitochondrial n=1 Tax=Tolypocladium ophioglossoides (strain CBS 100239) TaxID=1163406 RepID=A0A0L0NBP9_TOLOC|nr:CCA tRNA nucleotidyltransferase, mitochondrial [Tolypocladium ophioglossoides CBS 100239]
MLSRLGRFRPRLAMKKRKFDSFLRDSHTHVPTNRASTCARAMPARSIQLNAREQQLRRLLLDVCRSIDAAGDVGEPLVVRWAGGWVRDRLLGVESHDIDVAINAMTGVAFAQRMCDFCASPDAIDRHAIGPDDVGNLHNVARNPEKSKHLETAMVRMFSLDLDFVNLRRETYARDSRNPHMEFGTAEEDALRRDATINALFYNLHTGHVEDFTGGLPDMAARTIRTPLDPLQTFTDDPLRVLRLVRFASRLKFTIDPATEQVMDHHKVLDALRVKISRERVGVELEKMLKGSHPRRALELLDRLNLYHAIFTDPAQEAPTGPDTTRWHAAYQCLDHLMQNRSPGSIFTLLVFSDDAAYLAWNLAAVCPWMTVQDPPDPGRKANAPPPVALVAREGFKAPNKLTDIMAASQRHRKEIVELKRAVCSKEPFIHERDRFGMAIRRWDAQGGFWALQVLSALLVDAMDHPEAWSGRDVEERESFLRGWQRFLDHLVELDVYNAPALKRLLDGRSLAQSLGVRPGKWTGGALDVCMTWQRRNPHETNPQEAIEEVRRRRDELGIPAAG